MNKMQSRARWTEHRLIGGWLVVSLGGAVYQASDLQASRWTAVSDVCHQCAIVNIVWSDLHQALHS
jgi:hypothetical protein